MPVWNQPEIQQASQQVDELFTKLREYSMASESEKPALLADLQALSAGMDEGALTEYLSLMTQIQSLLDSGMSEAEVQALFPDIDFSTQLDQFAGIVDYLDLIKTDLPGLYSMFGEALPEEVLKIATDLDMTGAQARWDEFAQRHAEPAFMHIAAHGLGESFQIFLSVRVQRTVKIQKTLLALGQFAVFILYTEKFIQRDVQKQAKSAQRLSVRLSLVRFPVADGVLVDSHALREIALVVLCTGAIFADHIAKGICEFLLYRVRL